MKARFILFFVLASALFSGCSLYYAAIKTESKFYSGDQLDLLEKICAASGYGHGFDEDTNLDYFFVNNRARAADKAVDSAVRGVLKSAGESAGVDLFEKILYLHELTLYTMKRHEELDYWKGYTYISKYLLPALEQYEGLIQRNISALYPSYLNAENKRKESAEKIKEEFKESGNVDFWQTVR
ncbi:MAG: hypothetical protein LBT84_07410 [Spirochaetia bacterium]|nr:hypothetical protein [Spirochaetia bacterium]